MPLRRFGDRPVLAVLVGAVTISFSGILFRLAHVSPSTGAFYRCVWALPPLWALATREDRRFGRRPLRARLVAWGAGVFFAVDLILWHNAIEQVGAGLATVLGNTQVVLVGLLAWVLLQERPQRSSLMAIPIVAVGVVLISGVLEQGAYGANPRLGAVYGVLTGIAYSGFLLTLREGSRDLRRTAGPLFDATLSAALGCAAIGAVVGDLDLIPSWSAMGWLILLAVSSQVLGWLLISLSLPRLPAVITSILLTLQPVCSVIFAALIVDEKPSALQLVGAACILAGLVTATLGRRAARVPEPELAG
ncbi:MAG: DMT family transporter [Actinobacteria bacterium]|nr:MAG: DMT family transporter [Actinomycetota bacterium]